MKKDLMCGVFLQFIAATLLLKGCNQTVKATVNFYTCQSTCISPQITALLVTNRIVT